MAREPHFAVKYSSYLGTAIKLVLYILKQLFASVSVNSGGYLPRRSGSVNIHRYSPPLRRIIVKYTQAKLGWGKEVNELTLTLVTYQSPKNYPWKHSQHHGHGCNGPDVTEHSHVNALARGKGLPVHHNGQPWWCEQVHIFKGAHSSKRFLPRAVDWHDDVCLPTEDPLV